MNSLTTLQTGIEQDAKCLGENGGRGANTKIKFWLICPLTVTKEAKDERNDGRRGVYEKMKSYP